MILPSFNTSIRSASLTVEKRWLIRRAARPRASLRKRLEDDRLGLGVQGTGGFVQNEDPLHHEQNPAHHGPTLSALPDEAQRTHELR